MDIAAVWQAFFDTAQRSGWIVPVSVALLPVLLVVVGTLLYLMGRMGWRRIEEKTVTCPETGQDASTTQDVSHEPEGVVHVLACSRFSGGPIQCDQGCVKWHPRELTKAA